MITLAVLMGRDPDALTCDMAQYYHIFDMRSLPPELYATLAIGLPPESRIARNLAGRGYTDMEILVASAVDRLSLILYSKTKDAKHGRNKPESIVDAMLGRDGQKKHDDIMSFSSGEEFDKARSQAIAKNLKTKRGNRNGRRKNNR